MLKATQLRKAKASSQVNGFFGLSSEFKSLLTMTDKDNENSQELLSQSPKFTRILTFLLVPLLLIFILYLDFSTIANDHAKVAFGLKWVYIFLAAGLLWIANVVSTSVIGCLPLVIFPLMGIVNSKKTSEQFMSNSNMATYGIIILMVGIDNSGMRRRLTLTILKYTNGSIRWIYIYVFLITTWISMWLSSMGATYLMLRTIDDILETLKGEIAHGAMGDERILELQKLHNIKALKSHNEPKVAFQELSTTPSQNEINPEAPDEKPIEELPNKVYSSVNIEEEFKLFEHESQELLHKFGGELLYAVAVAANIGGSLWPHGSTVGIEMNIREITHTTTTTSSNVTVAIYRWTQASWMIYSFPLLLINSAVALKFLLWVNFKGKARLCNCTQSEHSLAKMKGVFAAKLDELGPWTYQDLNITVFAISLVVLCLARSPLFILGWSDMLPGSRNPKNFIETADSVVYILIGTLLFLMPKYGTKIYGGPQFPGDKIKRDGLLEWKVLQKKFPWSILCLIGASRLIGVFSQNTVADKIANRIGSTVPISGPISIVLLKLILMGLIILCSIFISNTGGVLAVLNVWTTLTSIYEGRDKNLILGGGVMLPAFSVASLCFIIPTSSIPTILVYKYKEKNDLSMSYFLRVGIPLSLCTLVITIIYALLWTPDVLTLR